MILAEETELLKMIQSLCVNTFIFIQPALGREIGGTKVDYKTSSFFLLTSK